ncbi:MAG: DNA-binding MurR/RpiR family transcriptional regulator, partial [Paracoccaceae bacterium]
MQLSPCIGCASNLAFKVMSLDPKLSFEARIQRALPDLHPSERRLADAILTFPGHLASYSATELAKIANVSNATVTRFVRKVGFASFEQARQAARDAPDHDAALARIKPLNPQTDQFVERHLAQSQINLDRSFAGITASAIDALAHCMIGAPRVFVLGYRAGQPFARYLGWQVLQVLPNVTVLPRDGETVSEMVGTMTAEDCVVVFSLRRSPKALSAIKSLLVSNGPKIACIGDTAQATDLKTQWYFDCKTSATGPIFDHVAIIALCGLIASRVIELSGDEGR